MHIAFPDSSSSVRFTEPTGLFDYLIVLIVLNRLVLQRGLNLVKNNFLHNIFYYYFFIFRYCILNYSKPQNIYLDTRIGQVRIIFQDNSIQEKKTIIFTDNIKVALSAEIIFKKNCYAV